MVQNPLNPFGLLHECSEGRAWHGKGNLKDAAGSFLPSLVVTIIKLGFRLSAITK